MPPAEPITASHPVPPATLSPLLRRQLRLLAVCAVVLGVCFAKPLFSLVWFSLHSELYSYILLIPFVSLYLAWLKKSSLPLDSEPGRKLSLLPLAAGLLSIFGYFFAHHSGSKLAPADSLAWTTLSFVFLFVGACVFSLGKQTLRAVAFPLAFLIFLVPFPVIVRDAIESLLQHRSADVASGLFSLSGMPFLRQDTFFQLPGMSLEVAPECSGIRSTVVLFITGLVAGYLFLRSPWRRAVLTLSVIPLALLRNGFRVFTIGELCVQIGPHMIHSPIHTRGGPLFFALSLVPFFLFLLWMRRAERRQYRPNTSR